MRASSKVAVWLCSRSSWVEVPAEAVLVVRPANEPERRVPLTKNLDDPVFGTSLPDIKSELTYRVEYGGEQHARFQSHDVRVSASRTRRCESHVSRIHRLVGEND